MVLRTTGAGGLVAMMRAAWPLAPPRPAEDLSWLLHGPTDPDVVEQAAPARHWPLAAE